MLDFDTFSNFTKFARLSFLSNGNAPINVRPAGGGGGGGDACQGGGI